MAEYLWVEDYRPKTVDDCVLPTSLKNTFNGFVNKGKLPNMILSGGPGVGKTSVIKALCNQLDLDFMMINGSDEGRNIDTVRTTLAQYCSSVSISGGRKVVIVDEADYMNPDSVQPALRMFTEKFGGNVSFCFTCNYRNRIIEPIHSRCAVFDFVIPKKEKPKLADEILKRCQYILDAEGITYDVKVLVELVMKYFPDFRRVINELQRYSTSGVIDAVISSN